jgi:5-oxoprolinase (ATP-hydrolysing) subunit A
MSEIECDLNSDLGEGYGPWKMGDDAAILDVVTSANVACGGHASDPETMYQTLLLAKERNVVVGAHPGYADREGFGRRIIPCTPGEIERFVVAQTASLFGIAALTGTRVAYVKPHGALANLAADDEDVAEAIARGIQIFSKDLAVLAISGTALEVAAKRRGMQVFSEIFADRGYLANGRLVPRSRAGAMIKGPEEAADRLIAFFRTGDMPTIDGKPVRLAAHSICVHGDGPSAVAMAKHVRDALQAAGLAIKPFLPAAS